MRASNSQIALWAVLLFFGLHLLGELIASLLLQNFDLTWGEGVARFWEIPNVFYLLPFALLVVLYLFVRRLDDHILSNMWLYAIVMGVVGFASVPVTSSFESYSSYLWWATALGMGRFLILVWFARRVSALSFRHSLLLIVLATAMQSPISFIPPHVHVDPKFVWPVPVYLSQLFGGVLLRGFAVWSLVNVRLVTSSTKSVLMVVIAMLLLVAVLFGVTINIWARISEQDWLPMLFVGVSSLVAPAFTVVITYAVRVRRPAEPESGLKLQSS